MAIRHRWGREWPSVWGLAVVTYVSRIRRSTWEGRKGGIVEGARREPRHGRVIEGAVWPGGSSTFGRKKRGRIRGEEFPPFSAARFGPRNLQFPGSGSRVKRKAREGSWGSGLGGGGPRVGRFRRKDWPGIPGGCRAGSGPGTESGSFPKEIGGNRPARFGRAGRPGGGRVGFQTRGRGEEPGAVWPGEGGGKIYRPFFGNQRGGEGPRRGAFLFPGPSANPPKGGRGWRGQFWEANQTGPRGFPGGGFTPFPGGPGRGRGFAPPNTAGLPWGENLVGVWPRKSFGPGAKGWGGPKRGKRGPHGGAKRVCGPPKGGALGARLRQGGGAQSPARRGSPNKGGATRGSKLGGKPPLGGYRKGRKKRPGENPAGENGGGPPKRGDTWGAPTCGGE